MLQIRATLLTCALLGITAAESLKPRDSLELSCVDRNYIGVLAETRDRKTIPSVQMTLVDPLGRSQGKQQIGASATQVIPNSQYSAIQQIPGFSRPTLARAVQICDADQGVYSLTVQERGTEPYHLSVTASAKAIDQVTLPLKHMSRKGRVRKYRFIFTVERDHVTLSWLDQDGKPQMRIENSEW